MTYLISLGAAEIAPSPTPEIKRISPREFLEGISRRTQEFEQRRQHRMEQQRIRELQEIEEKRRVDQETCAKLMRSRMPVGYDRRTKAVDERERAVRIYIYQKISYITTNLLL